MNEDENKGIVFQLGYELPSQQKVSMQIANLRLHAWGVFSNVYRGTLLSPGTEQEIAIKKTWPKTPERNFELLFLSGIRRKPHKNVVQMLFAFSRNTISGQGLEAKNSHMIIHRDIKPINLLIDIDRGVLKIADFGSAKVVQHGSHSTSYQVTRFYRPPELLLDAKEYYWMVDVWSAGCCIGEMMKGKVIFPGASKEIMLKLIVQAIGVPSERDHDYMKTSKAIDPVSDVKVVGLKEVLGNVCQEWADFIGEILRYRPRQRLHGPKLLAHSFFDQIFAPKCTLPNGVHVTQVISLDDWKTAQRNDCTAGRQYAAAVLRNELKFSLNAVHSVPPISITVTSSVPKDCKEPSKAQAPKNESNSNVISPTAIISLK